MLTMFGRYLTRAGCGPSHMTSNMAEETYVSVKEVDVKEGDQMNTDTANKPLICPSPKQAQTTLKDNPDKMELSSPTEEDSNSGSTTPTPSTKGLAAMPGQMDGIEERENIPEPSEKALGKRKVANFEEVINFLPTPNIALVLSFQSLKLFRRSTREASIIALNIV